MTTTYITAAICIWAIVCIFALALNHGAHRKPTPTEIRRVRELESN